METTVFYIAAGALVFLALATSAIGIRSKDFPSPTAFRAGLALFVVLVGVTTTFALLNAQKEQKARQAKEAQTPR